MVEIQKEVNNNSITPKKPVTNAIPNKSAMAKPKTVAKPKTLKIKPSPKKTTPQNVRYRFAGKETLAQSIRRAMPKSFIPTKKVGYIFGGIFVFVLIMALIQFPFGSLIAGDIDVSVKIGLPWTFLELKMMEPGELPLKLGNLIIDMILYLILAYAIDISINVIMASSTFKSKEERKSIPQVFKNQKPKSTSEAATKKIFKKEKVVPSLPEKTKTPEKPKSTTAPNIQELTVPKKV